MVSGKNNIKDCDSPKFDELMGMERLDLISKIFDLAKQVDSLKEENKKLKDYKTYHEFAEKQIEFVIGEPITTLGELAKRFKDLKEKNGE